MLNAELKSMNSILTYESFCQEKRQGKKTQVVVFLISCCVSDSCCVLIRCCVSDRCCVF